MTYGNGKPRIWRKVRNKKLKINAHMKNLKKYLDGFYWYEKSNDELFTSRATPLTNIDYPSTYQTYFGLSPVLFLRIVEKYLPQNKIKKFENYIISEGFDVIERGVDSFKYVHHKRKIVISGDTTNQTDIDEEDDDGNGGEYPPLTIGSKEDTIFISCLPTIENKIFIENFIKSLNKFLIDVSKDSNKFYLIAQNQSGLFTQKTKFKSIPIKGNRYDLFYGEKFPHEKMKRFIETETENLMLLHGDPGTGKSNYIKHIITNSKKKVIYIAPSMLSVISSPQFVTFMMNNKDSILLIEDAEEVLSIQRNSATNNLLGLTDGFLKDSLGLKVIATFNCDIGQIDPALMRKGRMFLEYKFSELSIDECEKLANHLEVDRPITEPMTLAEFFNVEDNHIENSFESRKIGFI
jgi:hypothetical protein